MLPEGKEQVRKESARTIYLVTGFSRQTQRIEWPLPSRRGSTPKYLRSEFLQLNRCGRGRFFWPNSANRVVDVVCFVPGANSPK